MPPGATHSPIGASKSYRWLNCPGSVAFTATLPDSKPGPDALVGTAVHALAERCLNDWEVPDAFVGAKIEGVEIDQQMIDGANFYIKQIRKRCDPGSRMWIEKPLDTLKFIHPLLHTTLDCLILSGDKRTCYYLDYKNGVKAVSAEGNTQLLYGLDAAGHLEEFKEVQAFVGVIVSPNAFGAKVSEMTVSRQDLGTWQTDVLAPACAALANNLRAAPLCAGPWCDATWCPARGRCPEQYEQVQKDAMIEFDKADQHVVLPRVSELPIELVSRIYQSKEQVETFFSACYQRLRGELEAGRPAGSWILAEVPGRKREWSSLEEVAQTFKFLAGQEYEHELKSPAQMEKALKASGMPGKEAKSLVDKFAVKSASTVQMVLDDGKTPKLASGADEAFEGI